MTASYTDIDLSFTKHPTTKDVMLKTDAASIAQALKILLLTKHYEKRFDPSFGSNIYNSLFDPISPFTAMNLKLEITNTIKNYESRITLNSVIVTPDYDNELYIIGIEYFIENMVQLFKVDFFLQRLR